MTLIDRAAGFFAELQSAICDEIEQCDGGARFTRDQWERPGGGGGVSRVLDGGQVFEKAGVNWSDVRGELPEDLAAQMPGQGRAFRASGVSLVLHPRSPMVPTTHANFRCIAKEGAQWFGGGSDLTPYYLYRDDVAHFHGVLKSACDRHTPIGDYPRFKKWCDDYFYLPHRKETRGVGGLFFDYLKVSGDQEPVFDFVKDCGRSFTQAYLPIVERRRQEPYGEAERAWQLLRRGRYVEFNLLYDRGTVFGLKTDGRVESILMSMPPLVRWAYCPEIVSGSREAELVDNLRPQEWI